MIVTGVLQARLQVASPPSRRPFHGQSRHASREALLQDPFEGFSLVLEDLDSADPAEEGAELVGDAVLDGFLHDHRGPQPSAFQFRFEDGFDKALELGPLESEPALPHVDEGPSAAHHLLVRELAPPVEDHFSQGDVARPLFTDEPHPLIHQVGNGHAALQRPSYRALVMRDPVLAMRWKKQGAGFETWM